MAIAIIVIYSIVIPPRWLFSRIKGGFGSYDDFVGFYFYDVVKLLKQHVYKTYQVSSGKETSRNLQNFEPMKVKKPYGTAISIHSNSYKHNTLTDLASLAGPWLANEL